MNRVSLLTYNAQIEGEKILLKKYRNIALLILISFNLRIAIISVSSNLYTIKTDLSLLNSQSGFLTSAPLIFMGLFALTVNRVQKRLGQRRGIGLFVIILGLATLARIFVSNYWSLLITAAIAGICIAIVGPLLSGFIKLHFPNNVSAMVALYTTVMGIGQTIVAALSARLIDLLGSWQFAIGIWGIVAVIAGVLWFLLAPDEEEAPMIQPSQEHTIGRAPEDVSTASLWRNPLLWQLIALYGAQAANNYSFSTWLQPYIVSQGSSTEYGAYLVSIHTLAQTLANFIVLSLASRPKKLKETILLCGISLGTGAILLMLMSNHFFFAALAVILISFGGTGIFNISLIIPIRISDTAQVASVTTSLMQTVGYGIAAAAPLLLGMVMDATGFMNILIVLNVSMAILIMILSQSSVVSLANEK